MYYNENLPKITEIIKIIKNDGILIRNAKDAVSNIL